MLWRGWSLICKINPYTKLRTLFLAETQGIQLKAKQSRGRIIIFPTTRSVIIFFFQNNTSSQDKDRPRLEQRSQPNWTGLFRLTAETIVSEDKAPGRESFYKFEKLALNIKRQSPKPKANSQKEAEHKLYP